MYKHFLCTYVKGTYEFFYGSDQTYGYRSTYEWANKSQVLSATSTPTDITQDFVKYMFLKTTNKEHQNINSNFGLKLFHLPISYPKGRCFR